MTRWHLCNGLRVSKRTCSAETYAEALAFFTQRVPLTEGYYVISESSHVLGWPKPLEPSRCKSCGIRDRKMGFDRCDPCELRHRRESTPAEAKATWNRTARAKMSPEQKDAKRAHDREVYARTNRAKDIEAHRQARILAGVLRRRAKLTTTGV